MEYIKTYEEFSIDEMSKEKTIGKVGMVIGGAFVANAILVPLIVAGLAYKLTMLLKLMIDVQKNKYYLKKKIYAETDPDKREKLKEEYHGLTLKQADIKMKIEKIKKEIDSKKNKLKEKGKELDPKKVERTKKQIEEYNKQIASYVQMERDLKKPKGNKVKVVSEPTIKFK